MLVCSGVLTAILCDFTGNQNLKCWYRFLFSCPTNRKYFGVTVKSALLQKIQQCKLDFKKSKIEFTTYIKEFLVFCQNLCHVNIADSKCHLELLITLFTHMTRAYVLCIFIFVFSNANYQHHTFYNRKFVTYDIDSLCPDSQFGSHWGIFLSLHCTEHHLCNGTCYCSQTQMSEHLGIYPHNL